MSRDPLQTNDLASVYVIVGSNRITAWGESGGVTFKPNADKVTMMVGAGGHAVASRSSDEHWTAELTVLRASNDYALLMGELAAQHPAAGGGIAKLSFLMEDTISGEKISTDFAVFTMKPEIAVGKDIAEATFTLFLNAPTYTPPSTV